MNFEISVLILILAGVMCSISQATHKLLINKGWSVSQLSLGLMVVEIVVGLPFFIWGGPLPTIKEAWLVAIATAGIFSLGKLATFKAFETTPLSVVIILQRLSLVVTAVLANIFLNELSSPFRWLGLVVIIVSSIILGLATHHENKRKNITATASIGLIYALVAVVSSGTAAVIDKIALNYFSNWSFIWIDTVLVGGFIWLIAIFRQRKIPNVTPIIKKEVWWLILAGSTNLLAFGILLSLMKRWDVSLVMPIYKISTLLVTVLAGWLWLKEKDQVWSKTIALVLGCIGIWLMSK